MAQDNPAIKIIIVDPSGKGNFKSVQAAINSLPKSSVALRVIFIRKGVYKEKIYIEKPNIILRGEDREEHHHHTIYCPRPVALYAQRQLGGSHNEY